MDAVELEIKLGWVQRELEEKAALVTCLREDLNSVLAENAALTDKVTRLKAAQETIIRDKLAAENRFQEALREKAELASENAKLHVYAREAVHKAESAIAVATHLRGVAEARSRAEEAVLQTAENSDTAEESIVDADKDVGLGAARSLPARLQAAHILIARLLTVLQQHKLPFLDDPAAILGNPGKDYSNSAASLSPVLQAELLSAVATQLRCLPEQTVRARSKAGKEEGSTAMTDKPSHWMLPPLETDAEAADSSNHAHINSTPDGEPSPSAATATPVNPIARPFNNLWKILVGETDPESPARSMAMAPVDWAVPPSAPAPHGSSGGDSGRNTEGKPPR